MQTFNARALYVATLKTMHDGERRLVEALPGLAEAAGNTALQSVFIGHRGESDMHRTLLAGLLEDLGETTAGVNQVVIALLGQGDAVTQAGADDATRDVALFGMAWQTTHFEIAGYTTLIKLAATLGRVRDMVALQQALEEAQAVDEALNDIAARAPAPKAMAGEPRASVEYMLPGQSLETNARASGARGRWPAA